MTTVVREIETRNNTGVFEETIADFVQSTKAEMDKLLVGRSKPVPDRVRVTITAEYAESEGIVE